MAVILNWKNTIKESKERFITSFFSFISSGWYIKNVINSPDADYLDAYDFIDVYSEEFYLANQEVIKTFNDLSIADARTTNIALRGRLNYMIILARIYLRLKILFNISIHIIL